MTLAAYVRAFGTSFLLVGACALHAASLNSSTPYFNGANIPWNSFGMDFGTHPSWGAGYDPTWWYNTFVALKNQKINAARIWLHCDGRASPEFNSSGDVTGIDSNLIPNLQDMLDKANANGVRVQLCLWSFDMCNDNTATAGPYAGRHHTLITNSTYRTNYINRALNPILDGIKDKPALTVIEVINEPEWAISGGGASTTYQVTRDQMRAFVKAVRDAVKAKTSKHVTTGSASVKWSTANGKDGTSGDYWSGLGLDHREVHYYDWMVGSGYNFDPFASGHTPAYYGWTTPAVIGEFGGNGNTPYGSVLEMMNRAYNNGYAGHMPWSYKGGDAEGAFNDFKAAALSFANNPGGGSGGATVVYGFESATSTWGVKWGTGSAAPTTTQKQEGARSLGVSFSNSGDAGVGVDSPANAAGKTITLWVWVPNQSALNGLQAFVQYGSGWTWTGGTWFSNASLTKNAWNRITVAAPAGQTVQRLGVSFDFASTYTGTFYIDGVAY